MSRFFLMFAQQEKFHLIGGCAYYNYQATSQTPHPVVITGRQGADGNLWPDAKTQVASAVDGKWITIGETNAADQLASVTIKPNEINSALNVSLDVFQPMIAKYKFGRIVLNTGDAAVFELKDLSPPAKTN